MDNNQNLETIIAGILNDYASTCNVAPFKGRVIIASDMAQAYLGLRQDLVESGKTNLTEIQKYHGLTVQPKDINGDFTILLNQDYVAETVTKNNIDWVGTLVHEAVHVNDFKDYYRIINPESYDELYEYDLHRVFLYWTEFHARAVGHYFLRKYSLKDFKDESHINYIVNTELPYHINYLVNELASTNDADRQMYVVAHFLGRIAVWQFLYPHVFDNNFIEQMTNNNPWMKEIFDVFTAYDTLREIYPHFQEITNILDEHFS